MTSLDDTIISSKNLILLDNVTNLQKTSLDYFHSDALDYYNTWSILTKLGKYKLLRLPSCSIENKSDYDTYLQRLCQCVWRRWSMERFNLKDKKLDPLDINWNKEIDVTLLYGPDLSLYDDEQQENEDCLTEPLLHRHKSDIVALCDENGSTAALLEDEEEEYDDDRSLVYSASIGSNSSSIFEHSDHPRHNHKELKFNDNVLRRDISLDGRMVETNTTINDQLKQDVNDIPYTHIGLYTKVHVPATSNEYMYNQYIYT